MALSLSLQSLCAGRCLSRPRPRHRCFTGPPPSVMSGRLLLQGESAAEELLPFLVFIASAPGSHGIGVQRHNTRGLHDRDDDNRADPTALSDAIRRLARRLIPPPHQTKILQNMGLANCVVL